jgi:integrase
VARTGCSTCCPGRCGTTLTEVIRSGIVARGDELPSITELSALQGVAKVIAEARARNAALGLYLWLVVVTGVRRGELCGLQIRDIDLDRGLVHVAFNHVVRAGRRVRKDTKTLPVVAGL